MWLNETHTREDTVSYCATVNRLVDLFLWSMIGRYNLFWFISGVSQLSCPFLHRVLFSLCNSNAEVSWAAVSFLGMLAMTQWVFSLLSWCSLSASKSSASPGSELQVLSLSLDRHTDFEDETTLPLDFNINPAWVLGNICRLAHLSFHSHAKIPSTVCVILFPKKITKSFLWV